MGELRVPPNPLLLILRGSLKFYNNKNKGRGHRG